MAQLHKKAIRCTGDYHERDNPQGIRRQPSDFNQVSNHQQRNRNAHGDTFIAARFQRVR